MSTRLASAVVTTCLLSLSTEALRGKVDALAQTPAPNLSRQQRELLQAIVTAVDAARSQPDTVDLQWQHHILRASDGSHYVAFSMDPPPHHDLPAGAALLYIRLATATPAGSTPVIERSPIREWLAGSRTDPRMLPRRGTAMGEMPAFGAGAIAARGSTPSPSSTDLKLMEFERQRAKQEQEDRDAERRAAAEGRATAPRDVLPFEDFDLASRSVRADGKRHVSRAFTAGAGDYELYVAWADPASPKAPVRVVRKSLRLPAARSAELTTSSIILAEKVSTRAAPYQPAEQASHPYSIGLMEIIPALSARYRRNDNLSTVFQVINAASTDAGMPDVAVGFRIVRVSADRETPVASLNPQYYNSTTLPPDFSLRLGHPLFAAVTAPLASLPRGDYRLKIVVNDRLGGTSTNAETVFTVIGTPASLLTEAPALGPLFRRDAALDPGTISEIVTALTPPSPSAELARALAVARTGKLVDLLIEEPVPASETGVRTALTGLAFLAVGDASAATYFERALAQKDAAAGPVHFLLGVARASQSRDPDAITAWQAALTTDSAPSATRLLLAGALLRRNDPQRAAEAIASGTGAPRGAAWVRTTAAAHIANRREADALGVLEPHLAVDPADQETRWLLLHALYSQFIRSGQPIAPAGVENFTKHARAYIDAKGVNAGLAEEWLKAIFLI